MPLLSTTAISCTACTTNSLPQRCRRVHFFKMHWILSKKAMFQVQLLQKHDADLEKSVKALAADASIKGSMSNQLHCDLKTMHPSNPSPAVEAAASAHRAETLKLLVRPNCCILPPSRRPRSHSVSLPASG
jgi:hypothetical protein